jgi:hypothetical protein
VRSLSPGTCGKRGNLPLPQTQAPPADGFPGEDQRAGPRSYGSWREGSHDDLVLAVAVAAWYGERWRSSTLSVPSTSYSTL